jgi:hypothetical protein
MYSSRRWATRSAFEVRETERGRDCVDFDYRIVAHPVGRSDERLPVARTLRGR